MDKIDIRGARTHNLKNISLQIPRDKLIVITGLSGSGKSSLAFDTLYAEGQRRYVESLSAYARQFLSLKKSLAKKAFSVLIIYKKELFFSEKCRKTKVNCRNKIDSITHLFSLHIY